MGIDKAQIEGQLASLDAQEAHFRQQIAEASGALAETRGAQRLCRFWLGKLSREQAQAGPAATPSDNDAAAAAGPVPAQV